MNTAKLFLKELLNAWNISRSPRLAAALAYYSLFSLVPMLFIALGVAGMFFENLNVSQQIFSQLEAVFGTQTVEFLRTVMQDLANRSNGSGALSSLIGLVALFYAATGIFAQLRDAINTIWEGPAILRNAPKQIILDRLLAFVLVLSTGLLFVAATFANLVISLIASFFRISLPLSLANNALLLLLTAAALAVLYKILPDAKVAWRDVWVGALITGSIYFLAVQLLSIYFSSSNLASAFGAASALAVLLVSVYYMGQIFLVGAVFTKVYAYRFGSKRAPVPKTDQEAGP